MTPAWQSWNEPISTAEIGRRVEIEFRHSHAEAAGVFIHSSRAPKATVRLDDGTLIALHSECERYRLVGAV